MAVAFNTMISNLLSNPNPYPDGQVVDPTPAILAAAGTTQATAAPVVNDVTTISNNTAANGVILPVPTAGQTFYIIPALATNAPKVYPPVGGSINFGTANASVAITAQKLAQFIALDSVGNYALLQSA